jgi:hypothetical protein
MRRRTNPLTTVAALAVPLAFAGGAPASTVPTYTAATPSLDTVFGTSANPAPWTLTQGDTALNGGNLYSAFSPSFSFGASNATVPLTPSTDAPDSTAPNYAVYPGASTTDNLSGSYPYATGYAGDPGPVDGYCSSGGANPETGSVENEPVGAQLPLSPYYFPFVMRNPNNRTC